MADASKQRRIDARAVARRDQRIAERRQGSPLLGGRWAYGLAFLSGFLYFLAFPGIDVWPLAFVALVPLIVALRGQSARRGAGLGWLAGFTMTMFGFYWLLGMLQTFSGFPLPLCFLFMAILCAYQAGRIALMGWLYARAEQRGWPAGLVFAGAFAASEQLYPLLFPWYYGATVHQVPWLTQLAELGGPIAVALVLVAANLALAELVLARLARRPVRYRHVALLAAVPVAAVLYAAVRIPQVDATVAAAPRARVGLVQANMSLMGKRQNKLEGLRRHMQLTRQITDQGPVDLIVWSETSVVGAVEEDAAPLEYKLRFARHIGAPAIFGGVLVRRVPDARRYVLFNSALASDAEGNVVGRYDKQFLLAFGEYLPFGESFPVLYDWSPNSGRFTPGKTLEPLPVDGHHAAVFICYEDISPAFVNSIMRTGEAQLLVNMTNDAWFGDTTEPWIHLALAKFRAIEQRRFLVRSTNSGVSAFVDPVGRVMSHTSTFTAESLSEELAWLEGKTPYRVIGDVPWWLVSLAMLAAAFWRRPGWAAAKYGSDSAGDDSTSDDPAGDGPVDDDPAGDDSTSDDSTSDDPAGEGPVDDDPAGGDSGPSRTDR